jgi:hypothetical protein
LKTGYPLGNIDKKNRVITFNNNIAHELNILARSSGLTLLRN